MLGARAATAAPRDELKAANKMFREGNYPDARDKYNALLYPDIQLADSNDLVEAYVNLGVCRLETGDDNGAQREFEKALQIDPNKQLDPLVITNKKAIALFDDTKSDLRLRGEREKNARREAEERERINRIRASMIGVQTNSKLLIGVPFGVGQFQNGDNRKGAFFLGAGLITFTTSTGIFAYLTNKYGIKSDKVPLEDGPRVRRLQQFEIGTGIAFWGLWIWGAYDAYRHFKPQTRVKLDESLLPPELRETPPPPKKKEKTSYHLVPMLTPDGTGAGIGIGWEN
jgi:tetratricopeptide (TPR) repeat protein